MYAFGEDGLIDQDWRPAAGCAPTPAWLRLGKMPAGVDESVAQHPRHYYSRFGQRGEIVWEVTIRCHA